MAMLTKYEILKGYISSNHPEYVRDTWVNLGSALISSTSRTFIKDMVYRVDPAFVSTDLAGSILLCEASLYNSDPLDWPAVVVEDEDNGYFSFSAGVITPYFRILLYPEDVAAISVPINTAFVPYSEILTSDILIADEELEIILTEAGVPFVLMEELEFPRNKICNNMIKPAMQEYFKYFPILKEEVIQQAVTTSGQRFEIEMPETAYGVKHAYVHQGTGGSGPSGNPLYFFANEIAAWGGGSGSSPIRYGGNSRPGYANLQGMNTVMLDRAARQGIINYASRAHTSVIKKNGKKYLSGYANKCGQLEILWTCYSNNWNDIEFDRLSEVRKLATANVLRALGMLRGQVKADIPGGLNFDMFINRAKELETEVLDFWKNKPVAVAIRGSM